MRGLRRQGQLTLAFALFALVVLTATLVPLGFGLQANHEQAYIDQRARETTSVARSLIGQPAGVRERIIRDRYPVGGFTAGWLLDSVTLQGPVTERSLFPEPARAEEIREVAGGPDAFRIAEGRLFLAVPVIEGGRLAQIVWISSSLRPVADLDRRSWVSLAIAGGAATIAAAILGALLARRLSRRLAQLAEGAARFGEGDLAARIDMPGGDEVSILSERLNEMASRLARLLQHEKDFVSAASHQLRTPLTAIRIRIDEIRALSEDAEVRAYLDEMAAEVDRLSGLASRLMDLAGAEAARAFTLIDAAEVATYTVARVEPLARRKGVRIRLAAEPVPKIVAAPGALDEVLLNLLDNAVKFSRPGGSVRVDLSVADDHLVLQVEDGGPGIPPSDRARVMEPFVRGGSGGGHGLGLALCARICRAADATLELTDADGGGTRVRVAWPLGTERRTGEPARPTGPI